MSKVLFCPSSSMDGFELISSYLDDGINVLFSKEIPENADYTILVCARPTRDHLLASPKLTRIIVPFTGPAPSTIRLLADFPHVLLHQLPYDSSAVAETALALMLAAAKFVIPADVKLRQGDWSIRDSGQPQLLLKGKTVLLLGYGRVGSYLATILRAMNMEVSAIRRQLPEGKNDGAVESISGVRLFGKSDLPKLLPYSDVLVCTLPNTLETDDWIGAKELGRLPEHAIVVNVGNARVFDEAALFVALRSKHIAGAGLDVWYEQPHTEAEQTDKQPSRFPFASLGNVVMSPHRAGKLGHEDAGRVKLLAEMINKAHKDEPVPYRVDLELGY